MKKIYKIIAIISIFSIFQIIITSNFRSQAINSSDGEKFEDGTYKIILASDSNMAVTIAAESTENGANVQIEKYLDLPSQEFNLIRDSSGYYEIVAVNSEKRLDVCGWDNGANIEQWVENKNSDSQKWVIKKNSNGTYNIISKRNNLHLTVHNSILEHGTNIEGYKENNEAGQEFKLEKVNKIEEGTYKISLANSPSQTITVANGKKENGANIEIRKDANRGYQQFKIKYTDQGYVEIIGFNSEKMLDVCGWGNGTNVAQWSENKVSDSQKWIIKKNSNGTYNIISQRQHLYLTAHNSNFADGTNIEVYEKNNSNGQEFKIEKVVEEKIEAKRTIEDGVYKIAVNSSKNKSVTISNGSTENGTNVNIWDYDDNPYQEFRFVYDGNGYYEIIAFNSGKRLDVCGWGNGANVEQWSENKNTDSQKWIVYKNNQENYNIISKRQNLFLTVNTSNFSNGTNIEAYENVKEDSQEFSLEKIDKIEEGTYKIVLANSPKQAITVENGNNENGANIIIQKYKNQPQQQFELKYNSQGYIEIIPVNSGKRLDVCGWGNETNVAQWGENQVSDSQKWIIKRNSNGNYNIISQRQHLYLTAHNSNDANGTNIEVFQKNAQSGQEFKIEKPTDVELEPEKTVEEGTYKIKMASNLNKVVTIDGENTENGANVCLLEDKGLDSQEFNLSYDGDGYYEIISVNSGKRLDVCGWGNGTNVAQWSRNKVSDSQKWIIYVGDDGKYHIISKRDNLYLTIHDSNSSDKTNIEVYEKNNSSGQEFILEKLTNKSERTISDGNYQLLCKTNNNISIEVEGGYTNNNARVQIWKNYKAKWQKVKIKYENGYYKIGLAHSGKYFTLKDHKIESGAEIVQYEWHDGENQKWIIRDRGDGSIEILPLENQGLAINARGKIEDGSIIELSTKSDSTNQEFSIVNTNIGVEIDSSKYPGIQEAIDNIANLHPNWQFEILYTTIDFGTAVNSEYEYENKKGNLVYTPTYKCDWIAENPYVSGNWASASYNAIAYFMDIRNFLNDVDVFQFVDLGDYNASGATIESIRYQVEGTFLQGYEEDVKRACENTNINPYYVLARLFQEQSVDGSGTINMDGGDGKRYFNPFNIGAQVGNDIPTALERAKREGWDSMQKGLEGGIKIIKKRYIDAKQNTLYLNKFDVNPASGGGFYSNQYMQNVSAAYSEARVFRSAYVDTGTLNNNIKFIIPVYENMPNSVSQKPTGTGKNPLKSDKGPINVKVVSNDGTLALRDGPSTSGTKVIERVAPGKILLSVERLQNGWHKVVAPSGNKGYCYGSYLSKVDDQTNCNEKVYVKTSDNSGVNMRIGPGTEYDIVSRVSDGTILTRIVTGKYYYNYWWDEVVLSDGTKGFIATNYLVRKE